jgi:hypothetical protein
MTKDQKVVCSNHAGCNLLILSCLRWKSVGNIEVRFKMLAHCLHVSQA